MAPRSALIQSILRSWPASAQLAFVDGLRGGLNPQQAADFASAQYGESGFNPTARNTSSGAAGLYQLLSSGYVNRANQLGGVFNPQANIEAILPSYRSFYQSHPGAVTPGLAGSDVELSGEPASYYAQGYQHLPGISQVQNAKGLPPINIPPVTSPMPPAGGLHGPNPNPGQPPWTGLYPPGTIQNNTPSPADRVSALGKSLALQLTSAAQSMLSGGTPNLNTLFAAAKGFQEARAQLSKVGTAPLGGGTGLALKAGGSLKA